MGDNDQDRTERQSQKKLEQSRDRGELPCSQELVTCIVFAVFLIYFGMLRVRWLEAFGGIMRDTLNMDRDLNLTTSNLGEFLIGPFGRAALLVAPLFAMILLLPPLISMAQTGFNIAKQKIAFDMSRLNPMSGLKRMVSMRQWIEGGKSMLKICLFLWLAWLPIRNALPTIATIGARDLRDQINLLFDLAFAIGVRLTIMMAILALFDYGYQWWTFYKSTLMSHQELKEEIKEREGNPLIKQRQRSVALQRARQRTLPKSPRRRS